MPNHVINEVIFRGVNAEQQAAILAKVSSAQSPIDFEVLLPIPTNYWWGGVSQFHERAFPGNALDSCTENWSTKWNAYGLDEGDRYQSIVQNVDTLTLTFQTAWSAPLGWLCALFNTTRESFSYRYISEGGSPAKAGEFTASDVGWGEWEEHEADEALARHLHKLLWGVEEFEGDDE